MKIEIEKLRNVRTKKDEYIKAEIDFNESIVQDISLMDNVYRIFTELSKNGSQDKYMLRKQFIFIAVWMFSPYSLMDVKLRSGVREKIAHLLDLHCAGAVSNELQDLLFYYETYAGFRNDVDYKYHKIREAMNI